MTVINGIQTSETLHEGKHSIVYRGTRPESNEPVVIKVLKSEYPTADQLAKFRQEYEIASKIASDVIVQPLALENYGNGLALVFEDFGGKSLKEIISAHKLSLKAFLQIGTRLANALAEIHSRGVIHKDIKPANILINTQNSRVKLIDFGISTTLSRENTEMVAPGQLEGTLTYISPEQTGRMNRAVDNRTDFYSLGVTFYEMLTGAPPFPESTDPMELVHNHIAVQAKPVTAVNSSVPGVVSDIVMKLLAKNAEDRYQSGFGLKADLENCLRQLQSNQKIEAFEIGTRDASDRFQISEKLYGREADIGELLELRKRVARGSSEILLLTGAAGIGKTALLEEIQRPFAEESGEFVGARYDQFKRDVPNSAISSALQELVRQVLTRDQATIDAWRERVLEAVGRNGAVLAGLVPNLDLILGDHPEVEELTPAEAENRFNSVFSLFMSSLGTQDAPFVLYLDNMQWVDSSSLKLLEILTANRESRHLLILLAYRDSEVDSEHVFSQSLQRMRDIDAPLSTHALSSLDLDTINDLVATSLNCPTERSRPLAELILAKTNGNPFFANEFLQRLYQDGALNFDAASGGWQWSLDAARGMNISDNVVELMANKIRQLPDTARSVLKAAACVGSELDFSTLRVAFSGKYPELIDGLNDLVREGLILPVGSDYKFLLETGEEKAAELNVGLKFLHDRVLQAAYDDMPEADRATVHLKIGRHLLKKYTEAELKENLIDTVNHFNSGLDQITDPGEKKTIAALNQSAALKAQASVAYEPAARYIHNTLALLPQNIWQSDYDTALSAYQNAVTIEFLNGSYDEADKFFQTVIREAKSVLDKVSVYSLFIQYNNAVQQADRALDEGALPFLKELGVSLPKNPGQFDVVTQLLRTKATQGFKKTMSLVDIPEIKDPKKIAAIEILAQAAVSAFFARPNLFPVILFKVMRISMRSGASAYFAYFSSFYAMVLNGVLGDIKGGFEFSEAAFALIDRYPSKKLRAKLGFIMGWFLRTWSEPFEVTQKYFHEGAQLALEMGDPESMIFSRGAECYVELFRGTDLPSLLRMLDSAVNDAFKYKQEQSAGFILPEVQMLHNLMGRSENPAVLQGDAFDLEKDTPVFMEKRNFVAAYYAYICAAMSCYYFRDYEGVLANIAENEKLADAALAAPIRAYEYLFQGLAMARLYDQASAKERKAYKKKIAGNIKKLKAFAKEQPQNRQHLVELLEAEYSRAQGQNSAALKAYDAAIASARQDGYLHMEALANELAAEFYITLGNEKVARTYMTDARYGYQRWGATAKLQDLDTTHSEMMRKIASAENMYSGGGGLADTRGLTTTGTGTGGSRSLDIGTVMKATQTLSEEIFLDKLLGNMIRIVIENAGAGRGVLMLEKDGALFAEAQGTVGGDTEVMQSIRIDSDDLVPLSIVHYVQRTGENVVLGNAGTEGRFVQSPYVQRKQSKSVLCMPVVKAKKLVGILYLENDITTNAFTPDRLETLNILTAQAAISIENARLVSEETERQKLKKEMEVAKNVQMSILPNALEDDAYNIAAHMTPAEQVGGDYYDYYRIGEDRWVAIGDVTGHGLNSGLLMLMAQTGFSTYLNSTGTPDTVELFKSVNKTLYDNMATRTKQNLYMTFTALRADAHGNFEHVGKHEDILVWRKATQKVEIVKTDGVWIGIVPDVSGMVDKLNFKLEPGDFITLFTDGVIECRDTSRQQFDTERLISAIETNASSGLEAVKDAIVKDCFDFMDIQDDDVTLFLMQKK